MKNVLTTIILLAFCQIAFTQPAITDKMVKESTQKFVADQLKWLKEDAAPNFFINGHEGIVINNEGVKKLFDMMKVERYDLSDIQITQYGKAAIVRGVVNQSGYARATKQPYAFHERITEVLEFQKGKWLVASTHATLIEPPAFTQQTFDEVSKGMMAGINDYAAKNMSPEYRFVNGEGIALTGEQLLAAFKTSKISKWELSDVKIKQSGNLVNITGTNKHTISSLDNSMYWPYDVRFNYNYEYRDGKWLWTYAQHTHIAPMNTLDEMAAIKKTLEDETHTFNTNPKETFEKHWNLATNSFLMGTWDNGKFNNMNSAQIKEVAKTLTPSNGRSTKTNHRITLKGNIAIVDYDNMQPNSDGTNSLLHNLCLLEKINGEWKFIGEVVIKTDAVK